MGRESFRLYCRAEWGVSELRCLLEGVRVSRISLFMYFVGFSFWLGIDCLGRAWFWFES